MEIENIGRKETCEAGTVPVGELFRTVGYEGEGWYMHVRANKDLDIFKRSTDILAVNLKSGMLSLVYKRQNVTRPDESKLTAKVL